MKAEIKSSKFYNILCGVGKVADDMGYPCYVVGGFVRDLLLYKDNDDIEQGTVIVKEYFVSNNNFSLFINH